MREAMGSPIYKMDMQLKTTAGDDLGGQNWLTINFPDDASWGICSSNAVIQGRRGSYSIREKDGYEGTTCWKGQNTDPASGTIAFRLAIFRGGIIDQASWAVGKSGQGQWFDTPAGIAKDFTWVILTINGQGTTSDATDPGDADYAYA
jgi:hypothetical protein